MQCDSGGRLARLIPVIAALTLASCDDHSQPLAPPAGETAQNAVTRVAKPGSPSISGVDFGTDPYVIDGVMRLVPVTVTNPGRTALKDVAVLATITQPGASRPVASSPVGCPDSPAGVLPAGASCVVQLAVTINNSVAGTGTLVAGPAQFETRMVSGRKQTLVDSRSDGITLIDATPYIASLQTTSPNFILENPGEYTVSIENPGTVRANVQVQALIVQGTSERAAGSTVVICPDPTGVLPSGNCTFAYSALASNANGGSGDLVPGSASLVVQLWHGTTMLDSGSVPITIGPAGPYIHQLDLASNTFIVNGPAVPYTAYIRNPSDFVVEGVTVWGRIVQGNTFRTAGSEVVHCGSGYNPGDLPPSSECLESSGFVAQHLTGGDGVFEAGPAVLEIWIQSAQQELHKFTIPITLAF
jgi:hypothetical protein